MLRRFEHLYVKDDFKPFDFKSHSRLDHRFFKYRPDLGKDKIGLKAIRNLDIWFASPRTFNDPFDCLPASFMHSEKILARMIENAKQYPDFENDDDNVIRSKVQAILVQQPNLHENDSVSVFCLSKSPVAQVMWSYYASEHKGYVLEYEFNLEEEDCSDKWLFPLPVVYRSDRPESPSYSDPLEYYLYKSEHWRHEGEHRIFRRREAHPETIQPKQLRSIIFGARIDKNLKSELENEVDTFNRNHEHKIKTYSAKLSLSKYEVYIPKHDLFDVRQP